MRTSVATFALLLLLGATAWAEDEKDKEGLGYVMAFPMEEPKPSGGRVETVVVESSKAEDLRQVLGAYKAATRMRQRQQQPPQPLPPPMQRMPPPDQKPPLLLLVVHAPRPPVPAPFRAGPPMSGPPPGFLQGPPAGPHPGMSPYGMVPAPPVAPAQVQMPAPPSSHPPRTHAPLVAANRANGPPRDNGQGLHFAIVQEPYIVNSVMPAPSMNRGDFGPMMRPAFLPGPALFSGPPSPPPPHHPMMHGSHSMMPPPHMMHPDSPIMMRGPPMSHGPQMMHSPSMMVPFHAFMPAPPMMHGPPFMMHGPQMMPGAPMMHGPHMMPSPAAMMYGHMARPRVGPVVVVPVAVLFAERPEPQRESPREKPAQPPQPTPPTPPPAATRRITTMERLGVNYAPDEEDDDDLSPMATIRAANTVLRMLMSS
ncbi:uncharacterized protein [Dermacentor andersoni]|uniref:uncharacterized protein n=1 Tax=Dermacentor andersoni TaxID=34620 RepID=UPI003B3B8598